MIRTLVVLILIAFAIRVAWGHGWYEQSCCSDKDCHPVENGAVQNGKEGVAVEGFGLLSYSDPRLRWSRDDRDHICHNGIKLHCVYRRPMMQ